MKRKHANIETFAPSSTHSIHPAASPSAPPSEAKAVPDLAAFHNRLSLLQQHLETRKSVITAILSDPPLPGRAAGFESYCQRTMILEGQIAGLHESLATFAPGTD